ncbi:MAG: DUF1304 domain-containing protein [Myxococcaceae bacterium]
MRIAGTILVVLVAVEHLWFLVLEMFLFTKPTGLETFHLTQAAADTCAVLAQNQGLYNGFLSAALITAVATSSDLMRRFGLACVIVAGVFGTATVGDKALVLAQSGPAVVALIVSELARRAKPA